MKCSPRFLATLVCSVVLSVPACSTLDKSGTNQSSQATAVRQIDPQLAESPVPSTQIHANPAAPTAGSYRPWTPPPPRMPLSMADRVRKLNSLITCFMPDCF